MPGKQIDQFPPLAPARDRRAPTDPPPPRWRAPQPAAAEAQYPSSDGRPMADNTFQERAIRDAAAMLAHYFERREDVLVANNLLVYYVENRPKRRVVPDVMVSLGVPGDNRMSYFVWEEGKPPDFVLEVASPGTVDADLHEKPPLYARLGVREYFRYDPMGGLLPARLAGDRLKGGRYEPLPAERLPGAELSVRSAVLGLDLRYDGIAQRLRIWDPVRGEYLRTLSEEARARVEETRQRQKAERRVDQEARARQEAERQRDQEARQRVEEARARQEAERRWREAERQLEALRRSN